MSAVLPMTLFHVTETKHALDKLGKVNFPLLPKHKGRPQGKPQGTQLGSVKYKA